MKNILLVKFLSIFLFCVIFSICVSASSFRIVERGYAYKETRSIREKVILNGTDLWVAFEADMVIQEPKNGQVSFVFTPDQFPTGAPEDGKIFVVVKPEDKNVNYASYNEIKISTKNDDLYTIGLNNPDKTYIRQNIYNRSDCKFYFKK